jgi:hypothetical protein
MQNSLSSRLPAGLNHAGNQAFVRHMAETDAANAKLADVGPGPAAKLAAIVASHSKLWLAQGFIDAC